MDLKYPPLSTSTHNTLPCHPHIPELTPTTNKTSSSKQQQHAHTNSVNNQQFLPLSHRSQELINSNNHHYYYYYFSKPNASLIIVTFICYALFSIHDIQPAQAAVEQCNYERFLTGCYASANFKCDSFTNLCKCDPESPVLIGNNLCVKRAKANQTCQYHEQCDKEHGYYCSYSDHRLVNSSNPSLDLTLGPNNQPRCRFIPSTELHRLHKHNQKSSYQSSSLDHLAGRSHNSQVWPPRSRSSLHRYLWLFLFICGLGLILLLLLMKSHRYRIDRRSLSAHPEDGLSINSELDVPPPYEVAIRMKK